MVALKKIITVWLLPIGILLSILTSVELFDETTGDREGEFAALVLFGLTPVAAGAGLLHSVRCQTQQAESDRRRAIFFSTARRGKRQNQCAAFLQRS